MATKRKTRRPKTAAAKTTGSTKAKVKRAARMAKVSLDAAAHEADLALRGTARKLKRTVQKLQASVGEAKGPARRQARGIERKLLSALETAGKSMSAAARKAKSRLATRRRGSRQP